MIAADEVRCKLSIALQATLPSAITIYGTEEDNKVELNQNLFIVDASGCPKQPKSAESAVEGVLPPIVNCGT
jgi:hypothetical protein